MKAPLPLGQVFLLIYEGVYRRPEARRCPRPNLGGPMRPSTVAAWAGGVVVRVTPVEAATEGVVFVLVEVD